MRSRAIAVYSIGVAATVATCYYYGNLQPKSQHHNSVFRGEDLMRELVYGPSDKRIEEVMGISQEGFISLRKRLERNAGLEATRNMSTDEQLRIFLYAVTSDLSMRKLGEQFQRSTETVNSIYLKVTGHLLKPYFYRTIIKTAKSDDLISTYISIRTEFWPFFEDSIGVVDGIHIPVTPPSY
ncbi:hypothetical protein GcM3_183030 [Golovinomyces cichoracearum]|uniref:DUF8040 domain-containing protein n=1 Tax=Golovinomyces cichoracearum TaxID=62708 RepID=A0A420HLJ1_9PEZI|nr:hypothetical protein GcM3_183030 [Golovinomyces cichoracearum]